MPIPAVVGAAIITGAAGTGATIYASKSAGKANRRAQEAEERALDKQLAANKEANDATLAYERDVEARRRYEWDQEQQDERAQWDWYQQALEPYRQASAGALGSIAQMIGNLGGPPIARPTARTNAAPGVSAPPPGWSPSDMVRQANAAAAGAPRLATTTSAPRFSTMATPQVGGDLLNAAGQIADLIRNLPASARRSPYLDAREGTV